MLMLKLIGSPEELAKLDLPSGPAQLGQMIAMPSEEAAKKMAADHPLLFALVEIPAEDKEFHPSGNKMLLRTAQTKTK